MPRLLLVDNCPQVRAALRATAERAGWSIAGEAAEGRSAVRSFAELRPDAVSLDLVLPGPDELFALRRIRELDPAACIVVATAWPGRAILAEARRLGAATILLKPFDPAELLRAIASAGRSVPGMPYVAPTDLSAFSAAERTCLSASPVRVL